MRHQPDIVKSGQRLVVIICITIIYTYTSVNPDDQLPAPLEERTFNSRDI